MKKGFWKQFRQYLLVGGVSTILDWSIVYILVQYNVWGWVTVSIGFFAGFILNYILSVLRVFHTNTNPSYLRTITKTFLVAIL